VEQEKPSNLLRVDPSVRVSQVKRLQELKSKREAGRVEKTLTRLKEGAEGSDNLMPLIVEAVKAYATLGEICDVLREVFGEHRQVDTLGR
jgi:methylmalonyl-CoA mutase N-terminal domain/subunit